ncbi:restriction endonuclease subunit S [Levilactobacillus namurensis]|uniref:restriction endonuclease subunit S n=1 Tax=Levilactobacillus namurensis TaxID=380393 RepID=UPI001DBE8F5A|nr:restriction endonuclease subunit S [Levilactobacillus namurensis]HJE45276.1 restriction endonuclease subunit S [Levilactobacillus namurensis]
MQLDDLVTMKTGVNQLRLKDSSVDLYGYQDLVADLGRSVAQSETAEAAASEKSYQVVVGDIVFSTLQNTASIVTAETAGKVLTQNFVRWRIKHHQIDPRYLCYCVNQTDAVKRQLARFLEGSHVANKLSLKTLRTLEIPVPPREEQDLWGRLYFNLQRQATLQERLVALQTQLLRGLE